MDDGLARKYARTHCDRCRERFTELSTLSWFTMDIICEKCVDKEFELRKQMRASGRDPDRYENCGFIPVVMSLTE